MGEQQDDDPEFEAKMERVVGTNTAAREVRKSLEQLRSGSNPELAEIARDLLAGRIDLRTVARSDVYGKALMGATRKFQDWQARLSPQERADFDRQARERWDPDFQP